MGARGRDRRRGRALPLGWDETAAPADRDAPPGRPGRVPDPVGGDEPASPTAPRAGTGPSRRSRRLIAICAVLALVGGLLFALPRLLGATTGPEQVTAEYLQAVIDGDLETVRAHAPTAPSASAAALTPEILAGAEDRLESFEIQGVVVEAGTATVTAELRTGTARGQSTFTLTSTDSGAFSPTVWELAPVALPELRIDLIFGVQEIEIEGVAFPVNEIQLARETHEPRVALQLLPGTYEVTLAEVSPWLEAPRVTFEVPPNFGTDEMPVQELQHAVAEEGRTEVQRQIDAALEDCAASTSPAPDGCPFAAPGAADQGTWAITGPPHVSLLPMSTYLWIVQGEGTATFTPAAAADDGDGAGDSEPIEVPFGLSGVAALDGRGGLEAGLRFGSRTLGYCTDPETGGVDGAVILEEPGQEIWPECG